MKFHAPKEYLNPDLFYPKDCGHNTPKQEEWEVTTKSIKAGTCVEVHSLSRPGTAVTGKTEVH